MYHVFVGHDMSGGGMNEYVGVFPTLEDAHTAAKDSFGKEYDVCSWFHIATQNAASHELILHERWGTRKNNHGIYEWVEE